MDLTQEQNEKLTELRLIGLGLKIAYEQAKDEYARAKAIEEKAEQTALDRYNKCNNTKYTDSCEFVDNKAEFDKWLEYRQEEFSKLGVKIEIDKTYASQFIRAEHRAEMNYLKVATTFLRICNREQDADEIDKTIDTYIPDKFKQKLLALNDKFIGA